MRFTGIIAAAVTGLARLVSAEDLLFINTLKYSEYDRATEALGYSAKVVTQKEWMAMTVSDFSKYKAIIFSDPSCGNSPIDGFINDSKTAWSPAITGNVVVIGTDPSFHSISARTLIDNSIKFAASGDGTGLYMALGCEYNLVKTAEVTALSEFGKFVVRGSLSCYNHVHIVADSDVMDTLTDDALSGWYCSVHEAFSEYPIEGTGGFQALAIADGVLGVGSKPFGDGHIGLPYIISRGAIPKGCGNGVFEPKFEEECDLGKELNGQDGQLCSKSCKCLYGVKDAATGECKEKPHGVDPSGTGSVTYPNVTGSITYPNVTGSITYPNVTCTSCPYPTAVTTHATHTPSPVIVGIEIIYVVDVVEVCPANSTVTVTTTTCLSTYQRPIYAEETPGFPCYPCLMGTPNVTDFMTVHTTTCPGKPDETPTVTYKMCETCGNVTSTCGDLPGYTPGSSGSCPGCTPYLEPTPHTHNHGAEATAPFVTTMTSTYRIGPVPTTTGYVVVAGASHELGWGFTGVIGLFIAAISL